MTKGLFAPLLLCLLVIALLASACAIKADPEAANDVRLYQVLPIARRSIQPKRQNAEGWGEVIAVINLGERPHTLRGWSVQTESGTVLLPQLTLPPGKVIYLANDAASFQQNWNRTADFEYGMDTDKAVPDLKSVEQKIPVLNDNGDIVRLLDGSGKIVDILVFGEISDSPWPWTGPPVQLVASFPLRPENQVITRLRQGGVLRKEFAADAWSGGTAVQPGLSTGNWTNSAFQSDPSCGNREWIAFIEGNDEVVELVREVWEFDFTSGHPDVRTDNEKVDRPLQPDTYNASPCIRQGASPCRYR